MMLCHQNKKKAATERFPVGSRVWGLKGLGVIVPASCGSLCQGWAVKCSIFSTLARIEMASFPGFWFCIKGKAF